MPRAEIHEYSLVEPQTNVEIAGDVLRVKATPDGLTLQSDANVDGLSARVGYSLDFEKPKPGEPESVLTLESFLSLRDLARYGLRADDYLDGQAAMKARIDLFSGGRTRINADADLTNLTLKIDPVGWKKSAGIPAIAKLAGIRNSDGSGQLSAVSIRGAGLAALMAQRRSMLKEPLFAQIFQR